MRKQIFSIALAFLLLLTSAFPVAAAKKVEKEPIIITTVEEFLAFAENCRLDTYSIDLTVSLEADLDFTEVEVMPVPIFCGTFEGNGHRLSGLKLRGDGSYQGLFRYIAADAVVQNLVIEGNVAPEGSRGYIGALAGSNAGTVLNCKVIGTVSGTDGVGGLVGVNEVPGIVEQCTVQGTVTGSHFVGGIAGVNNGVIRNSVNEARINATAEENSVALTEITVEALTNSEASSTATNIGGIAGESVGVIRDCRNTASIGYQHMGYNIGGIAGSQSGYMAGCENLGNVYGRKEVGGIVGHLEPFTLLEYNRDALQVLEGQLNSLSAMTGQAGSTAVANASSITDEVDRMQGYADTARDALSVLTSPNGDPDSKIAAGSALSSSINGITSTMEGLSASATESAMEVSRELQSITNQINTMSATLKKATANTGVDYVDVSDEDTAKDTGGKVEACVNSGEVYGDLNIGGIAGAMAMENDLDAEKDLTVSGRESTNISGEVRAVVLGCENTGTVTGDKQHVGGIVGWQYMGLVKESVNTGSVEAASADYVGGISGHSSGFIRSCDSKCTLNGESYVGGIAGIAGIVTECHSMVEFLGGRERVGAVLGQSQTADTEEKQPICDNYYLIVGQDVGGIDGISYGGLAEPKGMAEFVTLKNLAEPFQTVTLRFVFEKGQPTELTVPLGGSISANEIPEIPQKAGYVSEWEGLSDVDLSNILFDMEFHARYISQTSVIASEETREEGIPVLLVQGLFTSDADVKLRELQNGPAVGLGQVLYEVWDIDVSEKGAVSALRYRLPEGCDGEHGKVYVCGSDGIWRSEKIAIDGNSAVIPFTGEDTAIAYAQAPVLTYVWVVAGIGALLILRQYQDKLPKKKK